MMYATATSAARMDADIVTRLELCCRSVCAVQVAHWTRLNSEPLDPALVAAELESRNKARAQEASSAVEHARMAEAEEKGEEQQDDEEEEDNAEEEKKKAEAAPAPAPVLTSRGRTIKKAEPPGQSLASMGAILNPPPPRKIANWNSEEYRKRNREKFQGAAVVAAASQAAAAAAAAEAASASASAAVAAAAAYTSASLDPLVPDRLANEVFQLPASWRVQWQQPSHRLINKIAFMPTTEFDIPRSFELPFDLFGTAMLKFQKKDIVPKFQMVTQSQ